MRVEPEYRKKAERLIYDYQKRRLEAEYSDFEGMEDVIELFFGHFYPPPEEREKFEKLKATFVRTMKNPLLRLISSGWVIGRLEEVAELDGLTLELNRAMADELLGTDPMPDELDDEMYFELSRRAVTREQRIRQFQCAVGGFELGIGVVLHFSLDLGQIIKIIPRPLVGNRTLFDLAVRTYKVFNSHRESLKEYLEVVKERETARQEKMYSGENRKIKDGGE